ARPEDVFIHIEVLRHSGFADLQAGEAVCLRIVEGKRGRMAVQVVSWEASARI
ncbi:MAG: cold-shock protein, partial [Rhodobacteraceae bacterium]|nr:cold-shock protein [Paracoccaceae bacterium]